MKIITVEASKKYDVKVGRGLLDKVGEELRAVLPKAKRAALISDDNVAPIYLARVKESLEAFGFEVFDFVFPHGERSKNGSTYLEIMNFMASVQITRSDVAIALGGGVVGDITGFAAATFLRGISFVQLPTSLLAMVDSSVGGKTAIDLPAGKNLAGAFCQPSLVLMDTDTLNTLPRKIFIDGCAEVIKYGVLYDPEFFSHLEESGLAFDREFVIKRCVELKAKVVMEDEYDTGARMKLNLGHTIGHGVEAKSSFSVSHGQAVSIGMAIVSRASGCPDTERIESVLNAFGLPIHTDYSADDLFSYTLSDKKRTGGIVNLIVPRSIGNCAIVPTPVENLKSFIQAGL